MVRHNEAFTLIQGRDGHIEAFMLNRVWIKYTEPFKLTQGRGWAH